MKNTSLVVGGRGLVGSAIFEELTSMGIDVRRTYFNVLPKGKNWWHLDLTKEETISRCLKQVTPDTVYICAAYTNVDKCQDNEQAEQINFHGTGYLIELCKKMGIFPVFFSSSYVFDGVKKSAYTEDDMPKPINDYGLWKMEIEGYVLDAGGLVIRTVGVFGKEDRNFMSQVLRIKKHDSIHVPDDQYMNPIWANDLAKISAELVEKGHFGITHVAGDTKMSKFDWAKQIQIYSGLTDLGKIYPSYGTRQTAKRPENGCLNTDKLFKSIPIPNFYTSLNRALLN